MFKFINMFNMSMTCSSVFIANFEHISHLFSSVFVVGFEQVNISWVLFLVKPYLFLCEVSCRISYLLK